MGERVEQDDWLQAALDMARDHVPELDVSAVGQALDNLAAPLREQQISELSPRRQAEELSHLLYVKAGFSGDREHYDDPANSLIHEVLRRRRGIPITLALVYCEVARRLGVPALGVGFPGHFLVKVVDPLRPGGIDRSVLVDPFNDGQVLTKDDLGRLAQSVNGSSQVDETWLAPAPIRDVRRRMLNNLRLQYGKRRELGSVLLVLHRICQSEPNGPIGYRERGLLHRKMGALYAAIDDLERYLELAPRASDVQQISETVDALRAQLHANPRRGLN